MNDTDIRFHLQNNSSRIIQKWDPALSIFFIQKELKLDSKLKLFFSQFGEWWEITRPNYDGLSDVFDKIINQLDSQELRLSDIEALKKLLPDDFLRCYDIKLWRNYQIDKLWQN